MYNLGVNFSIIHSAQNNIIEANAVDIETDITNGLYSFNIVGLADKAVEESKDRISSAIKNSGYTSPKKRNQKIVISLAPANIKKSGPNFDLPMAIAYLKSVGDICFCSEKKLFIGELSLDGKLRSVPGILPTIIYAKKEGFSEIYIPSGNIEEASLISGIKIFSASSLLEIIDHLTGKVFLNPITKTYMQQKDVANDNTQKNNQDWLYIRGQEKAKRGLQIAAAGGHNIGFYGPPGTGKTMLARSIVSLLPKLKYEQVIETTSIHSVSNISKGLVEYPPFRNPHHNSSLSSIIGGGAYLKPGEISLAHNGVLFLDELPEFNQKIIDSLRQPIEDGHITLSRLHQKARLPSNFILIVAMNPCPCGYYKSNVKACSCGISSIEKYRRKISGPVMDRIDMWIEVNNISYEEYNTASFSPIDVKKNKHLIQELNKIKTDVDCARGKQLSRQGTQSLNSKISANQISSFCSLSPKSQEIISRAMEILKLSVRSLHSTLKVARTIADLEGSFNIKENHLLEAIQYRNNLF